MRSLSRRPAWSPAVAVRAAVAIPFPPECGLSNALFIRNLNVLGAGLQGPLGEYELLLRMAILAALRDALVTLWTLPNIARTALAGLVRQQVSVQTFGSCPKEGPPWQQTPSAAVWCSR
jgi:hypothetical protein